MPSSGHDRAVTLFLPRRSEVLSVAQRAELPSSARAALRDKIKRPPDDWDERTILTVPGVVWTVSSDTCATGRLSAPENVAYDHLYREFVFRQPADAAELGAIMSADSEAVFACYRFDGLDRWTSRSVHAWMEDLDVVLGYVRHVLSTETDEKVLDGLTRYAAYLTSTELRHYLGNLRNALDSGLGKRRRARQ